MLLRKVITGFGVPFTSIIIGDISSAFIKAMSLESMNIPKETKNCSNILISGRNITYSWCHFQDDIITKCLYYVYLGILLFSSQFMLDSMALGQAGCASALFEIIDRKPKIDCYSKKD
uniref:Solute carrier family 40 protein n=1 Tax=Parastrongyloides trichosuri TaxID=131310 RepID=A0A0N4ZBJ0_PARTI